MTQLFTIVVSLLSHLSRRRHVFVVILTTDDWGAKVSMNRLEKKKEIRQ